MATNGKARKPPAKKADPGKADSRGEILRAAAELFMQFGYAATSIDAVAESLGATKGHIYHYYGSKADLFFDIQTAAMQRLLEGVEPLAMGKQPALERLAAMALRHTEILLTDLPMQKVAVQGLERHLFAGVAALRQLRAVLKLRDDYEQLFAEVIDQAIRDGVVVDLPPKLLTKPFFGAMNWATVWYSQRRLQSPQAVEEIARVLAGCAVRGLLVDPAAPAVRRLSLFSEHA
ncbi:TetR/AcrR family transcriptional regulator [Ramlibacter alkalitolerans]|uniref:TetR family transcriptional regulator n=1 Tax=Ramlibacter alkalitolerans TaxID=2039631 RepID=A0ABS1JP33_9BURK|nr:TetR/AcrR family transcriptional regulator [Ramlibacter alkalitolerans]MBL0425280.1 TetR family transcriptional regulator [Ramlibacter alkalitolerans]